jgi:hypothetical protein
MCCDITIHLVTINFQIFIPYSFTPCICGSGAPDRETHMEIIPTFYTKDDCGDAHVYADNNV